MPRSIRIHDGDHEFDCHVLRARHVIRDGIKWIEYTINLLGDLEYEYVRA